MNILFLAHGLHPCKVGGTEIFNYYLIKELTKSHKVFVMTCCMDKIDLDAAIIRINRRKFVSGKISIPILNLTNLMKLGKKIDVIHLPYTTPDWYTWIPLLIAAKRFGIPYIISIRGGGMRKWKPEFPYKYLFNNAAEIVGVSTRIKEEYEKRMGREIKHIPSGLPFQRCNEDREKLRTKYGYGLSDKIIVCIGSVQKLKGSDILLNAFINVGEKFIRKHNLKLLYVGEGKMKKDLIMEVRVKNFSEHVKFLGNVPHEEIPALYKISDIYVIPSLFEGMSNSLLEAMFNKLPIIGNDTSGIYNMIEHEKNGLLFKRNSSDDLKNKIEYLIKNNEISERIAGEARKTYDNEYSYEKVVKKYEDIYESVGRAQKK